MQNNLGTLPIMQTKIRPSETPAISLIERMIREQQHQYTNINSKAQRSTCFNQDLEFERSRNSPASKSALWTSPAGAVAKVRRTSALLNELKECLSFSSALGLCLLFSEWGEDDEPLELDPPELVRDLSQLITVVPWCSRKAGKVRRQQQIKPKLSSRKLLRRVSTMYIVPDTRPFSFSEIPKTYEYIAKLDKSHEGSVDLKIIGVLARRVMLRETTLS